MPGASVAIVGVPFTEVPASAAASGEIRLEPGTRVVIDTPNLPTSDAGIDAQWYTTVTSRSSAAGVTTEIAELKCYIDIGGAQTSGTEDDIIGDDGIASGLGAHSSAIFGTLLQGTMECLEVPTTGTADIDLVMATAGKKEGEASGGAATVEAGGNWTAGLVKVFGSEKITADNTFYLAHGAVSGGGVKTYGAGKFLLTFICQYAVPA